MFSILIVLGIRFWFVRKFPEFPKVGYGAGEVMLQGPYTDDVEEGSTSLKSKDRRSKMAQGSSRQGA